MEKSLFQPCLLQANPSYSVAGKNDSENYICSLWKGKKTANQDSFLSLINIRHKLKYRKKFCSLAADPLKQIRTRAVSGGREVLCDLHLERVE